MHAHRSRFALLLLLCFLRTLLPEAWILALHPHGHTTVEVAPTSAVVRKGYPLVEPKHQHCDVEQFYNVAFQPAGPVLLPAPPIAVAHRASLRALATRGLAGQLIRAWAQRGPPALA